MNVFIYRLLCRIRRDGNANEVPDLVNRSDAFAAVREGLSDRYEPSLYVYGPKGAGKTLLTRHAVQHLPEPTTVCHLSCIQYDTQYKVLAVLCTAVTRDDVSTGYHTAQLSTALTDALADQDVVIVLDDIDFLLLNDGEDLLYTLSRLKHPMKPRLVMLSATHPDLATELEERSYSSLRPYTITCEPYTEAETDRILHQRSHDWLEQVVTDGAIAHIAATTSNIHVGFHWLTLAGEVTDGRVTEDIVRLVQPDVLERYRTAQLAPFTEHHRLLLDAIDLLTAETEPVYSGAVYDWYHQLCSQTGTTPLSTRRSSDFLKHLELLGLIRADYHYGGTEGKTRSIWVSQLC